MRSTMFREMTRPEVWLVTVVTIALLAAPTMAKTTVRVMLWGTGQEYQPIFDEFERRYPDIDVVVELTPTFGGYSERVQIQAAAGVAPDVLRVSGAFLGTLAGAGIIEPLEPYIEQAGINMDDFMPTGDIFWHNGKLYGLGTQYDLIGLLYNKDVFSQHGVSEPTDLWNWADLRQAAAKLTERTEGQVTRYGVIMNAYPEFWGQSSWVNFLAQNGVRVLNESKTKATFNTPEGIEAIEFMRTFVVEDQSAPPIPQVYQWDFGKSQVAMDFTMMPNSFATLRESAPFAWDIAPVPLGKERASVTNTVGFSLNAASEVKDAAWLLLEFLATEGQMVAGQERLFMPVYKPAISEYIDPTETPTNFWHVLQVTAPYAIDLQFTPTWSRWSATLGTRISEAVSGFRATEIALAEAEQQVNAILASEW